MKVIHPLRKLGRWTGAGLLSLTLLLGYVTPMQAEASQNAGPDISPWSIETLNDGEKYGIYPLDWYYEGTFRQAITSEKFNSLMDATEAKLDLLGLEKKADSLSFETDEVITREAVITSLYKLLTNYDLPESFDITVASPIEHMQQIGVVKGTNAGLELEQPSTTEQAVVMASRMVEFTYDLTDGGADGLLWKVTNDENTMYLLGSIHLGITDMYPLDKDIRTAFDESDELWVEANILTGDMNYLVEKMVYNDGSTIKDHVSAETYEMLNKVLVKLGMPEGTLDGYKPFAASNTLSTFSYFEDPADSVMASATSIDSHFIASAIVQDKPVNELEGIKMQADLLSDVPADQQEKELNDVLDMLLSEDGAKESAEQLEQMQLLWVDGDLEAFKEFVGDMDQGTSGEVYDRLLGERDKNMAKKLAELLEREGEHTFFIVVGAAHYVTDGMVVDLLKEQGYDVQFVE